MTRLTDYLAARESLHPAFAEAVERLARADCDDALAAYRARLRERVEGLPAHEYAASSTAMAYSDGLDRAAVLALIDEEDPR